MTVIKPPAISVIVSTYNSPHLLERVLIGYERQSRRDFELIVADDGSGSPTRRLLERFRQRGILDLKYVWHRDRGFRKWRIVNKAIGKSNAPYLLFTDGDCIPHPDLVRMHLDRSENGHFLSGGYCRLNDTASNAIDEAAIISGEAFSALWLARNGLGLSRQLLKVARLPFGLNAFLDRFSTAKKTFNGNNSSCFRADALAVGGFDTRIQYGGGDREFGYRLENLGLKAKITRYSAPCLHLNHPRSYKSAEIRKRNLEIIQETRGKSRIRTEYGL